MVFDELVKKFELKVRACGWIILMNQRGGLSGWLICVSFVWQEPSWSITDRCFAFTVFMTVIVSTTNVGWRRSCWDPDFTTPDNHDIFKAYADAPDTCWWTDVYLCLHGLLDRIWWELLDSLHDNGYHDHVQELTSMLSTCHYTCIQQQDYDSSWFQWATTVWMQVILSLKDSRHGLSSIYCLFLHFEKSATFGTVDCLQKHTVKFHLMLILPGPFLFVLIPAFGDVALCFDVLHRRGGVDVCKRWDCDESTKRKRTLISSNSRRSLYDWGWVLSDCEWVLKSQKVYINWCLWLHKSFCWHWHSCFFALPVSDPRS